MNYIPLATALLLCGCASVMDRNAADNQMIQVTTTPPGAACRLSNDIGNWDIDSTPGYTYVMKDAGGMLIKKPLTVTCTKGNLSATDTFNAYPSGAGWGNAAFGGLGFLVDGAKGVAYKGQIHLTLQPK